MYDFVTIGDITIDLYYQGESLSIEKSRFSLACGGKYYADTFHHSIGGSGANVAIHASTMGMNVAVVAKVGESGLKNFIVQTLTRKTVSTEFLYFDRQYMSVSTILLSPKGERTIIKYSDKKDHIEVSTYTFERIQKSAVVFMGNLPDISIPERAHLLNKVKSDENTIALNLGSKDCRRGLSAMRPLLDSADIIILNRYEFAELIKKDPEKLDLSKSHLAAIGRNDCILIITDGSKGSHAYTAKDIFHQPPKKINKVIDTTGAGDAFSAGFLVRYHSTKDVQKSLEAGTHQASEVVSKIGAH